MAVVKRSSVAAPTLPKQTVEVEALCGDVVVRGLLMTEYMHVVQRMGALVQASKARKAADGSAASVVGSEMASVMPALLAVAVLDADEQPLWTEAEWQIFGGKHPLQAVALFNVAWSLAGLNAEDNAKN